LGGLRLTDNRKTRFDLRHALYCDLAAVTGRTLSQSARAAHLSIAARAFHFWSAMFVAITVSSTTATCLWLTPSAPATWLRPKFLAALARNQKSSFTVLITSACRIFRSTSGFPDVFPHKIQLAPNLMLTG
jgi:hypothetical protein